MFVDIYINFQTWLPLAGTAMHLLVLFNVIVFVYNKHPVCFLITDSKCTHSYQRPSRISTARTNHLIQHITPVCYRYDCIVLATFQISLSVASSSSCESRQPAFTMIICRSGLPGFAPFFSYQFPIWVQQIQLITYSYRLPGSVPKEATESEMVVKRVP